MKEKNFKKKSLRRTRKLLDSKLNNRNLIKGINTWAVPLVRYSGPFLDWMIEEQMNQSARKRMTMNKAIHPRDESEKLYVWRKEVGKELVSIEDSVDDKTTQNLLKKATGKSDYPIYQLLRSGRIWHKVNF